MLSSSAKVHKADDATAPQVVVTASTRKKCERCWHYCADVGVNAEHPTICGRCVTNLFGQPESRKHA